jgi:hypothetical protein
MNFADRKLDHQIHPEQEHQLVLRGHGNIVDYVC